MAARTAAHPIDEISATASGVGPFAAHPIQTWQSLSSYKAQEIGVNTLLTLGLGRLNPAGATESGLVAPRSAAPWNTFASDATQIEEAASVSRGLGSNQGIVAAMKTRNVDIDKLIPPATKPFADPIKVARYGQFNWSKYTPIQVEEAGGRLFLQEGMTRVEMARQAGLKQLPAYVYPKSGP